jgi:hypothetical protein
MGAPFAQPVYHPSPKPSRADNKARGVKIGMAFPNKDGSESVLQDVLPVDGKLQLRTPRPKEDTTATTRDPHQPDDWGIKDATHRKTAVVVPAGTMITPSMHPLPLGVAEGLAISALDRDG